LRITNVILSPAQPIGQIKDFFNSKLKKGTEFQSRGWPHIHCLFWCADAPSFDPNRYSNESFINYINKYISCSILDETNDKELHDIVKSVQMHSKKHSKSCKKGNKDCRFSFPRPVSCDTFVAIPTPPPENTPLATYKKAAADTLAVVWEAVNTSEEGEAVTDVFNRLHIDQHHYEAAQCALARKYTVIYKRNITECWVNPYNKDLLRAWNGNMDIQPVLDVYSCIMYIVSFISKAERKL